MTSDSFLSIQKSCLWLSPTWSLREGVFILANDTGPRPGHFIFSSHKKLFESKSTSQDTPRVLRGSASPRSSTLSRVICPQFEHSLHLVGISLSRLFIQVATQAFLPTCRPWGTLSSVPGVPIQSCVYSATPTCSHKLLPCPPR